MRKFLKYFSIFFLVALTITVGLLLYRYYHNFHIVIPNQLYRSRELTQQQFEQVIRQYHIKSLLNLRGKNPQSSWYIQELAAVNNTQIQHYDLTLESTKLPSIANLKQLVSILEKSSKPLLIHCESGVDRSSLASAIALILANDHSIANIQSQVSMKYFVLSKQSVGRQFVRLYSTWLSDKHLQTSRANFFIFLNELEKQGKYPHEQ